MAVTDVSGFIVKRGFSTARFFVSVGSVRVVCWNCNLCEVVRYVGKVARWQSLLVVK